MPDLNAWNDRMEQLRVAFEGDGFEVVRAAFPDEKTSCIGLLAKHRSARNKGVERKRAYYVEGSPWDMGYLMGRLAEPQIQEMSEDYIENFIRRMLPWVTADKKDSRDWPLYDWLVKRVNDLVPIGVPPDAALEPRIDEIRGMVEGCRAANPRTEVTEPRLWALNAGVDCLFSFLYEFELLKLIGGKRIEKLQAPTACNGLAILNDAAEEGALFARDFMFDACDVFQDAACLVVYHPLPRDPDGPLPFVSMTAPGFVGSISAMNTHGVAAGVDVVHAGNNDPEHLGINSLLLVRHAIENGPTIEAAVDRVLDAPRGVTWLYPMAADGGEGKDRACVIEAGATPRDEEGKPTGDLGFLGYPRRELKRERLLPTQEFLDDKASAASPQRNGAMVRWDDFEDPCGDRGYGAFNEKLWKRRLRPRLSWGKVKDQFGPEGRIHEKHAQRRCPSGSYFAPLRAEPGNIVLTSNHYVCPEMRLCAMGEWINVLDNRYADDSQWRYDRLNHLVQRARWYDEGSGARRQMPRRIPYDAAKRLVNFLEPACTGGECPYTVLRNCYHYRKYKSKACKRGKGPITIEGAISLFDLKRRTIESYFGYYGDEWVRISLMNYVDGAR